MRPAFDAAAYVRAIRDAGCTAQMCGDWFGVALGDGMSMMRLHERIEGHEQARRLDADWKMKIRAVLEAEAGAH